MTLETYNRSSPMQAWERQVTDDSELSAIIGGRKLRDITAAASDGADIALDGRPAIARALITNGPISIVAADDIIAATGLTDTTKAVTLAFTAGTFVTLNVHTRRLMLTGTTATQVVAIF